MNGWNFCFAASKPSTDGLGVWPAGPFTVVRVPNTPSVARTFCPYFFFIFHCCYFFLFAVFFLVYFNLCFAVNLMRFWPWSSENALMSNRESVLYWCRKPIINSAPRTVPDRLGDRLAGPFTVVTGVRIPHPWHVFFSPYFFKFKPHFSVITTYRYFLVEADSAYLSICKHNTSRCSNSSPQPPSDMAALLPGKLQARWKRTATLLRKYPFAPKSGYRSTRTIVVRRCKMPSPGGLVHF